MNAVGYFDLKSDVSAWLHDRELWENKLQMFPR
jgi:hypothetical protein